MVKQSNNEQKGFFSEMIHSVSDYVSLNWPKLIVFAVTFILSVAVLYLDANTSQTIASFTIGEYEVGQIADRTIIA